MIPVELSIVIVNWNSADYVLTCLRTVREQTTELSYEVIVVDNASFDGCRDRVLREHPGVVFIQSEENLGFARANNMGATYARGCVLLFLNPDTEIRDRAIERLYSRMQALPDAGIVGCRLLNSDGSLQTSCVQSLPTVVNQLLDAEVLRRWFPMAGLWGTAALSESGNSVAEVEAVAGACMMIRRGTFDRVGGFGSNYFMYTEDLDLCYRTRRAGFPTYYVGEAAIVHHGGGSSKQVRSNFSNVMMRESVGRFLRESRGPFYSTCYRAAMSGAAIVRLVMLMMLFPVCLARRRVFEWRSSWVKWVAIVRWGLGLTRWAHKAGQPEITAICKRGNA